MNCELVVIGAGPAGLAAAKAAYENGLRDIVIIERDTEPGGILNQCIHSGFGLQYFKQELTGPEYAARFIEDINQYGITLLLDTMALAIEGTAVTALNARDGVFVVEAKAVVLAMGCRERARGAIALPGTRPSGVYTAGLAQRYINIEGRLVGKKAVVLGSGDIGLIMARRLALEGAEVLACVEILPYSSGLSRNIAQCLDDFDIPLLLRHTVTEVHGKDRVCGVTVAEVDERRAPIAGTEVYYECDTLLLSVGLIPENELTREAGIALDAKTGGPLVRDNFETSQPGVFACGNAVMVYDLVDYVTTGAEQAGKSAAQYIKALAENGAEFALQPGENVTSVIPQIVRIDQNKTTEIFFRVGRPVARGDVVVRGADGAELLRKPREHLVPGEMERVVLAKQRVNSALTISVLEAAQ